MTIHSKATKSETRCVFSAQYYSMLKWDWDSSDPWADCEVKKPKSRKEARSQIVAYRKKYPGGVNKFRITKSTIVTQTTEYTIGESNE